MPSPVIVGGGDIKTARNDITYTKVSEVFIVVNCIANHKVIRDAKSNVCRTEQKAQCKYLALITVIMTITIIIIIVITRSLSTAKTPVTLVSE